MCRRKPVVGIVLLSRRGFKHVSLVIATHSHCTACRLVIATFWLAFFAYEMAENPVGTERDGITKWPLCWRTICTSKGCYQSGRYRFGEQNGMCNVLSNVGPKHEHYIAPKVHVTNPSIPATHTTHVSDIQRHVVSHCARVV